jgi:hypothetical protein
MLPRLVVADEDPEFLQRVLSLLAVGFNVVATAADGKEALELIDFHHPDVAILNYHMDKLSGLDVTRYLVRNPPSPPVVICSVETHFLIIEAGGRAWICVQEVGSARLGLGREISLGRTILPFPLAFGSVTTCAAGASWSLASCFRRTRRTFHDPAPNADHRIYRGHLPAWMFCADRRIHTCRYQNLAEDHP